MAQRIQDIVFDALKAIPNNPFSPDQVQQMITSFFNMGFDATYALNYDDKEIARHVYGYICGKANEVLGRRFEYAYEGEIDAFYFFQIGAQEELATQLRLERWLETKVGKYGKTHATSIRSYHSQCSDHSLVLITATKDPFIDPSGKGKGFNSLTTKEFLAQKSAKSRERYENVIVRMEASNVPVYTINKLDNNGVYALKMCFIPDRVSYLSSLVTLIQAIPKSEIIKKFCETFSNGMHVYTFYVRGATPAQLQEAAGLINLLSFRSKDVINVMYNEGLLDPHEVIYCNSLAHFAFYFTPPYKSEDFSELARELNPHPMSVGRLRKLRNEMFRQIMSYDLIYQLIRTNVGLIKMLYKDFAEGATADSISKLGVVCMSQLANNTEQEREIFRSFLTFNKSVLKTNFFKPNKSAVAYRLDPSFIAKMEYPRVPFGIYLIVGPQFIGFHVRFTDIARGGIRMILSNNNTYARNRVSLFMENYNLAYAQLMKNKDIPEGGSKGTILVEPSSTYDKKRTFLQYIDALCDLLVPDTPGVTGPMKGTEILFLGPDENTAGEFPAVAALHAKARGYKQWKSFTTGKNATLGGIPHDVYGMTSRGVRACVEGIYEKLGLTEANLTKFQTGGPDGDLGSNEIKLSKERYIALVDGSGSLHDPEGLNRAELLRLAVSRSTLSEYNTSKLSSKGFFVAVSDKNRTLPDGTLVQDGEQFRNTFHFSPYSVADVFVPCGGRPGSVQLDNVHKLISVAGVNGQAMIEGKVGNLAGTDKLRFKYIVEGANLFITHDARIALESVGVILIKDSSANKAGVTCSSFEVLAGLSLTDTEHAADMCVKADGTIPALYKQYVDEVIQILARNAKKEFECLWEERKKGSKGGLMTLISDDISSRIVSMRQFIIESNLHQDANLFRYVMSQYIPKTLQGRVPTTTIMERLPANYQRAMFAITIASDFGYKTGLSGTEFSFFQYMHDLILKANASAAKL